MKATLDRRPLITRSDVQRLEAGHRRAARDQVDVFMALTYIVVTVSVLIGLAIGLLGQYFGWFPPQ